MTVNQNPSPDHARHERLLVIRFLEKDDDLRPAELEQARQLIAACPDCAALASELQLITDSMVNMALPSRPRDFRITPQQAASLESGGLRRFLRRASAGFGFQLVRPLAGAAVAIGLLLVVAGSLPMSPRGQPTSPSLTAAPTASGERTSTGQEIATAAAGTPAAADTSSQPPQETTKGPAGMYGPGSASPEIIPDPSQATNMAVEPTAGGGGIANAGATAAPGTPSAEIAINARQGDADRPLDALSPLVVFGAMLAAVGLMVVGLTYLARRMGRASR